MAAAFRDFSVGYGNAVSEDSVKVVYANDCLWILDDEDPIASVYGGNKPAVTEPEYAFHGEISPLSNLSVNEINGDWTSYFSDLLTESVAKSRDFIRVSLENKISELRKEVSEEGEAFNEKSASHLLDFCCSLAANIEPAFACLANGNLRAIWQNPEKDQIGIQAFPDGLLQYVMLRDRNGITLKTLGEDDAATIKRIVDAADLMHLWFGK